MKGCRKRDHPAMLVSKRLAGVALRGKSGNETCKSGDKLLKSQNRRHQNSKTWVPVAPQKVLTSPKTFTEGCV